MAIRFCCSMTALTHLLSQARSGDAAAASQLWQAVYAELKQMAAGKMAGEKRQVTLQATVLVHEVWLRLGDGAAFENRAHFFTAASEAMRRILVDQARRRLSQKRGSGEEALQIEEAEIVTAGTDEKILQVHEVLDELAQHAPRQAEIVRLHFFVGLTNDEIAALLGIGESTVRREWTLAKAWLFQAIQGR
jgi:RNA polymerase sigma factor (TIGR02999 family)